jgi:hypothetical protein
MTFSSYKMMDLRGLVSIQLLHLLSSFSYSSLSPFLYTQNMPAMMLTNALYALVQSAKMWTPICPKKANFHHESNSQENAACPYCGGANPNPPSDDEVIIIPDSPPARPLVKPDTSKPIKAKGHARG